MWLDVGFTTWTLLARHVAAVTNNGTMVLRILPGTTADATGFRDTDVDNYGQIFIINQGIGDAIAVDGYTGGHPINTGLIAVQALNGTAFGYLFNNPSSLDNRAGGQILVEGMGAIAYYQASGDHPAYPSLINNAGTIRAVSLDPEALSFGLFLGGFGAGNRYIVSNSGLISADVAIYGTDDYGTVVGQVVHEVSNLAGGQIDGLIYLQRGADIVVNAGVINGDVLMGEGADRVDNRTGTINGITDLGWNNDIYQGGGATDLAAGGSGNDNLEGGGGNDQLMGGGGNDVLVGGSGNDGLFGEWGNDRIVTAGGDYVDGGDGNDRIELGDYSVEVVNGGAGFDTLVLAAGTRTLNLQAALATGRLADFEQIELGGNKTLVVTATDVALLTGGETALRLVTTASDRVNLVGTWTAGANQLIDGVSWRSFSSGGTTILVQGSGIVTPNGANSAGTLDPIASGGLAPVPGDGGLDFTSAVEVLDYYELNVPLTIEAHETYRSADGGVIFTCWDSSASLTNYGLIESIGLYASALSTNNISSVVNHGTIRVEATAVGFGAEAIYSDHFTDVDNYGLISAVALGGDAYGVWAASGTNSGTIEARTTTGSAYAVIVFNGIFAPFENSGLIAAISGGLAPGSTGAAAIGVQFESVKDAVNSGTIIATAEEGLAMAVTFSTGIYQSTLTNTGTITATSVVPHPAYPIQIAIKAYTSYGSSTFLLINGSQGEIYGDVYLDGPGSMTVQNSGLIDGSIWLGPFGVYPAGSVSINNLGQITGDLGLGSENAVSVTNNGRIDGAITLGLANDWFDGRLGIQGGLISGNDGSDTIFGGIGAETINGGGGGDTLIGGLGADLLTGGSGNDIFRDTKAGLSGDTITDFAVGDQIILTDAALSGFTFNLSGNTLTYTGGSLTLQGNFAGYQFVTGAASGGGVQLSVQSLETVNDVRNDFNGDGRSDILWRNVDGQMSNWLGQANGGFVQNNANAAAVVPVAWAIAGTGDFNGDGRDDILWRNVDGQISNWLATAAGGYTQNNANAAAVVPTAWHVVGTGDFNGDGRDDILWRHNDGTVSNWLGTAAGGFTANDANAARFAPTDWHVAGTGDFNGDGRDDVLWRNDNGQLSNWLGTATGGFTLNDAVALTMVDPAWKIAGTGDFNGDGRDDILWRHTDGTLSNWLGQANGGFVNNGGVSGTSVPLAWSVVAIGDYNGDGRDDILWRHTDGTLSNWLGTATGGFTPNDANAATPVPTSWHVQPEAFWL